MFLATAVGNEEDSSAIKILLIKDIKWKRFPFSSSCSLMTFHQFSEVWRSLSGEMVDPWSKNWWDCLPDINRRKLTVYNVLIVMSKLLGGREFEQNSNDDFQHSRSNTVFMHVFSAYLINLRRLFTVSLEFRTLLSFEIYIQLNIDSGLNNDWNIKHIVFYR